MIKLNSTTVAYDSDTVLHNISLNIKAGEKIALIGPSGAGKTTLLRKLYETLLAENNTEAGFIHQDFALIEQLSVFHNVYMGKLDIFSTIKNLRNFLLPSAAMKSEILPILERLGLQEKLFKKAGELSGGQKQRLAIARCLFKQAQVILADEPVASLDIQQAESVLSTLCQSAPTVIVSLHSTELALRFCNRIIALRDGKIIFDDTPASLNEQTLSELFKS